MLDQRVHHDVACLEPRASIHLLLWLLLFAMLTMGTCRPAIAEIRIVTSQGEYRMGDRDTKEDAIRLATESAKRHALEQVATFLESITIVEGVEITRDEIKTYTAGLVLVLDQRINLTVDGDVAVVTVYLTAQVDTDDVSRAISVLRENEDARRQLAALREEIDLLHQELDSAGQALAFAATPDQIQEAGQQRQEILKEIQSNAIVAQAWTDWVIVAPAVYPYPWAGISRATAQLHVARELYPNSPHVRAAHYEMVATQPPLPSQPPPSITQSAPPQPPGRAAPSTLNEFFRTIPPVRNPISNMSTATHEIITVPSGSRSWNEFRTLNPVPPPHNGTPPAGQELSTPGSRSARTFRHSMQPPPTASPLGLPPAAQQHSSRFNKPHPPMARQQAPLAPSRSVPPAIGGGNRRGSGHHGGGRRR